ncbi:MAG: YvcK family protein [Candidatus Paceibacterota bacterium]
MNKKKVVVVGGGTGTHTVLKGLKKYSDTLDITAIVSMADSGGSTGRLRDEFGQLPAGDVRNALTALAADGDDYDILLRQLFLYRFDRGEGLSGHNFGNLFLTVLTDILGSETEAIEAASRILRVSGRVVPVTTDPAHLVATYADGSVVVGEHDIEILADTALYEPENRIVSLTLTPEAFINPEATKVLKEADLIILGPGDLYTSVLANCVVNGFSEALTSSEATIVYVCNLMSKRGQTVGMNAAEHLAEVIKYSGAVPDAMIVNNREFADDLLHKYALEGNHPILNNCTADEPVVCSLPLVAEEEVRLDSGDVLMRSLIRHDADRLAEVLLTFL